MANELSVSSSVAASKGGVDVSASTSFTQTMAGEDMIDCTQTINTGVNLLNLGSITAPAAFLQVKNLDGTNFVQLASDSNFNASEIFAKILPGQHAAFPPKSNIYAKADSANCKVAICAVEA